MKTKNRADLEKKLLLLRELKVRNSRKSFYEFCQTLEPDFYTPNRTHLKVICDTLQDLYEQKLIREDGHIYDKLILAMPPRHGKSRTLVNFTKWCFGKDPVNNRVITASYGQDLSAEFSRYTRDGIMMNKNNPLDIVYADIFPDTKIKRGDASYKKFSLEGSHFSYLATSLGAAVTGKGMNISICDDLIKDSTVANNERELEKAYNWYTNTFLSREEKGAIAIMCATRWNENDPTGRIMQKEDSKDWYQLILPVYDEETDEMLCEEILDKDRFEYLRRNIEDPSIFYANYQQEIIQSQNRLYHSFKTYNAPPTEFEQIICYVDTADTGTDYLAAVAAGIYQGEAYVLDVVHSQASYEVTEKLVVDMLLKNDVRHCKVESNSGGRQFARNIQNMLWNEHKTRKIMIQPVAQRQNKVSRILTHAPFVMNHIYFPEMWRSKFPSYFKEMNRFMRDPKDNRNDDTADVTTSIAEWLVSGSLSTRTFDRSLLGL